MGAGGGAGGAADAGGARRLRPEPAPRPSRGRPRARTLAAAGPGPRQRSRKRADSAPNASSAAEHDDGQQRTPRAAAERDDWTGGQTAPYTASWIGGARPAGARAAP